ncbi:AIM24 family protein [Phocaeicola vulgatus]|jgi:uncharacterized protein (AIM24 family)|uniref:AIM24 family protein n=1 Tax=Phocaeicola vulgatus TaxID=821 RepID=UPI001F4379D8|nr:AIM24 family protein [Phocaeicola vulgatus]MCG0155213.1 AIM24 family protein [Phocaeicola vulgatus]MCG0329149.1 AIM24 family protein [Phocaeicola vulgatus]MCG0333034.1 AIM24 family protein [Phocaeicola vulgatus]
MKVKLIGADQKYLEIELEPNEDFYAEKGAMFYCDPNIEFEVKRQNSIIKSKISGESMFICRWYNPSNISGKLCIVGQYNSLLPIKIKQDDDLIIRCGEYVASNNKVEITSYTSFKKIISGVGLVFQKVRGESTIFIDDFSNTQVKQLTVGETIIVDENHILGFLNINNNNIKPIRDTKNIIAGEGLSILSITGPGTVFISPTALTSSENRSPVGCVIGFLYVLIIYAIIFGVVYLLEFVF